MTPDPYASPVGWFTARRLERPGTVHARLLDDLVLRITARVLDLVYVIGPPGSGKSVLLGRLADAMRDRCEPSWARARSPSLGEVVQANAFSATVPTLLAQLGHALGVPQVRDPEHLVDVVARRVRPVLFLVDDLDRAHPGCAALIAWQVLAPLADCDNCQVIVAAARPEAAPEYAEVVELEHRRDDVVSVFDEAVRSTPHFGDHLDALPASEPALSTIDAMASMAADLVAWQSPAFPPFPDLDELFAAYTADGLPGMVWWRDFNEALPYTTDYPPDGALTTLLRPLAFAQGKGLPEHAWLRLARALSPESVPPDRADLWWALRRARGLVIGEPDEHGAPLVRPADPVLRDWLKDGWEQVAHAALTDVLAGDLDDPYTLRHLAHHARRAGQPRGRAWRLSEVMGDLDLLSVARPRDVAPEIVDSDDPQVLRQARAYLPVTALLNDLTHRGRSALLYLGYALTGLDLHGRAAESLPWRLRWSRSAGFSQLAGFHADLVVRAELAGEPLVLGSQGSLAVWHLRTGARLATVPTGGRGDTWRVCVRDDEVVTFKVRVPDDYHEAKVGLRTGRRYDDAEFAFFPPDLERSQPDAGPVPPRADRA